MFRPLTLAAAVLSASAANAAVPSDWKQLVALTTSRGECVTDEDTRSEQYSHQTPGCSLRLDDGYRAGYVRVVGDASAPKGVSITLFTPSFTIGKGALSGQAHVAQHALSLYLDMDGNAIEAYRLDPAIYSSESDCASCSWTKYRVLHDESGAEIVLSIGTKKTPLSGAQLDAELTSAAELWRMKAQR